MFDDKYLSVAFDCNTSFVLKAYHMFRPFHPSRLCRRKEIWRKCGVQESFRFDAWRNKSVCSAYETGPHSAHFTVLNYTAFPRLARLTDASENAHCARNRVNICHALSASRLSEWLVRVLIIPRSHLHRPTTLRAVWHRFYARDHTHTHTSKRIVGTRRIPT